MAHSQVHCRTLPITSRSNPGFLKVFGGPGGSQVTVVDYDCESTQAYVYDVSDGSRRFVLEDETDRIGGISWSSNGRLMAVETHNMSDIEVYLCDVEAESSARLLDSEMLGHDPTLREYEQVPPFARLSPDGSMLAFCRREGDLLAGDSVQLCVLEVATGVIRELTAYRGRWAVEPTWSPDSRRIAFISHAWNDSKQANRLLIVRTDGRQVNSFSPQAYLESPSWSPNGENIVVACHQGPPQFEDGWSGPRRHAENSEYLNSRHARFGT